jgi:hypothetical protein
MISAYTLYVSSSSGYDHKAITERLMNDVHPQMRLVEKPSFGANVRLAAIHHSRL